MNKWLLFLLLGSLAVCQLQAHEEPTAIGKAYFNGYGCIRCHTVGGEGGSYGPDLTFVGFRKSSAWLDMWLKNPHAWKSNTVMPNLDLPDSVRDALVQYLSSLQGEPYLSNPPWNDPAVKNDPIKRGEMIFKRAGCVGCHGPRGVGGNPNNNVVGGKIPSLTNVSSGYSKDELEKKIHVGVPKSAKQDLRGPDPMIHMPAWGQKLKDDEIDSLADYLISLKPKTKGEEW